MLRNFSHRTLLVGLVVLYLTTPALNSIHHLQQTDSLEQLIQKVNDLIKEKAYSDAIIELKKALKLNKDSAVVKFLLSIAYGKRGDRNDAIKYAQEAINIQPDYPDCHYILALWFYDSYKVFRPTTSQTYKRDGIKLKQAEMEITLAINQGARSPNAYELKGRIEEEAGNFDEALKSYEEALKLITSNSSQQEKLEERTKALERFLTFKLEKTVIIDKRPIPINLPMPNYTESARKNKIQGFVLVFIQVDEKGQVKECIPFLRLGFGLDEEAVKAAQKLKFKPAMKDGKPVSFWQPVQIEFNMR